MIATRSAASRVVDPRSGATARQSYAWPLALLFVSGAAVRIYLLFEPMGYDEAFTFVHYAHSIKVALTDYSAPNNHILHTLFVYLSTTLFGSSVPAIRLPALLFGLLVFPAMWYLGRVWLHESGALVGVALAVGSPALILYATNARGYSIVTLAFLLLLILGERLRDKPSRNGWIAYGAVAALGCFTVPTMLFPLGAAVIWLWWHASRDSRVRTQLAITCAIAGAATIALYLPAIIGSGAKSIFGNTWVAPSPWSEFVQQIPGAVSGIWSFLNLGFPMAISVVAGVLALAGLWNPRVNPRFRSAFLITIAWCVTMLVVQHRHPVARVFVFFVPLYLMAVASGMAVVAHAFAEWLRLPRAKLLPTGAAALGLALSLYSATEARPVISAAHRGFRHSNEVVALLKTGMTPADRVLAGGSASGVLQYYLDDARIGSRRRDAVAGRRFFIVVLEYMRGQSVDRIRTNQLGPAGAGCAAPVLLRDYGDVSVFSMQC